MINSVAKNISRGWSSQICNNAPRISSLGGHHHITCKFPTFTLHSSRTFSSSSSGSHFGGFLKWYLGMLQTRPFTTKGISSSLIFAAADFTSQIITLPPSGSFDSFRTLRIAGYGLLVMGPSQHLWFNFLSRILPGRDVFTTVKKITMGQAIYGPIMNSIFFSYNAVLQGETREEVIARLKRDLFPTLRNGLMYWPLCDFLTFKYIPVHLQPLANSSFAYLWTIYLTYMASLKKVGKD
ncbi:protein sym-1 isoform X1 [Beta vulgaris subsp. vulgaris]|uniref:protein sym-1 isoform X1 n=1 Tax=Beta vulgaris subsp. vulgaris TaxID=3555 RepID=UPI002036B839|nr:protein sym-1 isoform X1 [Beta vulgaris subsp. vulgaris]